MLVWKFSFAPIEAKIQLFKSYCYPIYGCALWLHPYSRTLLENLLSPNQPHLLNIKLKWGSHIFVNLASYLGCTYWHHIK